MHIRWLLSVEQTRINPFTCNPAKLPCRQALHLKCTISYPCLVWMQHFWDIKPGGNTRRMAAATPYIVPPCCLFSVSVPVSVSILPFIPIFPPFFSLSCISWDELEGVGCHFGGEGGGEMRLQSCLNGGFIHCSMCFGRSVNMLPELPGQGWGNRLDKQRYFIQSAGPAARCKASCWPVAGGGKNLLVLPASSTDP